jgi:hypothetical protein
MGLITEHVKDREEAQLFGFFDHMLALVDDDTARSFIETVRKSDDEDVDNFVELRSSPEDRPGLQAFLSAITTKFGVSAFSDETFDMACATLAAIMAAGVPDDAKYIAKVAKFTDSFLEGGDNGVNVVEYEKRVPKKSDGKVDFAKLRSAVGAAGRTVGWAGTVAGIARSAYFNIPGVQKAVRGMTTVVRAARGTAGLAGRALSFVTRSGSKVGTSRVGSFIFRVGSKLITGNPWILTGVTIGGFALDALTEDD